MEQQNKKIIKLVSKSLNDDDQLTKKEPRKQIPKAIRKLVWDSHIGKTIGETLCKCCNDATISQMNFHCGHIIAASNGGQINVDNLLPICQLCNNSMYKTNLYDFKDKLDAAKKSQKLSNEKDDDSLTESSEIFECDICEKILSSYTSLWRHKKYSCKGKKKISHKTMTLIKEFDAMKQRVNKLEEQCKALLNLLEHKGIA